jgi:hypothetical protein
MAPPSSPASVPSALPPRIDPATCTPGELAALGTVLARAWGLDPAAHAPADLLVLGKVACAGLSPRGVFAAVESELRRRDLARAGELAAQARPAAPAPKGP